MELNFDRILEFITDTIEPKANYQKVMLLTILQKGEASKEEIDEKIINQNPGVGENFHSKEVYETLIDKHKIVKFNEDSKTYILNLTEELTTLEKDTLMEKLRDFFVAMGRWENWKVTLNEDKTLWGVNYKDKSGLGHYKFLKKGDIVFYQCTKEASPFDEAGIFGVGKVTKKFFDERTFESFVII